MTTSDDVTSFSALDAVEIHKNALWAVTVVLSVLDNQDNMD